VLSGLVKRIASEVDRKNADCAEDIPKLVVAD
jgi:hypothetical protein